MTVNAFELAANQPWLITEDGLRTVLEIAGRTNIESLDALNARAGNPLRGAARVQNVDGIAVVPIRGPIFRYANIFTDISGATSTESLARDIRTAIDDPLIDAIVLEINSPGGSAAGINELAEMVFKAREEKPIVAFAEHLMASAAYWIGSAAGEIVADPTSIIGSLGVVMALTDTRERDRRGGVRTLEIVSSQSPDKRLDIDADSTRAKLQKIVDDLAQVFVEAVARNRGVDVEDVLADFGQGGDMAGQRAVEAGMADRVGTFADVIAELSDSRNHTRRVFTMSRAKEPKGPITVATTAELRAALEAGHTGEEISLAVVDTDKIRAEAHAAGVEEGRAAAAKEAADAQAAAVKAARDEATAAERARITGLQTLALRGFEKDVADAIASGATVEATAVKITQKAADRGVTVEQLRKDSPAAVEHGGKGGEPAAHGRWGTITARFGKRSKRAG